MLQKSFCYLQEEGKDEVEIHIFNMNLKSSVHPLSVHVKLMVVKHACRLILV